MYKRQEQGRIWIGSHDGIAQVVEDKAVLVEENHDASKMMSFGKDVFFLSEMCIRDRFLTGWKEKQFYPFYLKNVRLSIHGMVLIALIVHRLSLIHI